MSNLKDFTTMRLQFGNLVITPQVEDRLYSLGFSVPELEDAIDDHKSPGDGQPSVYVGTYSKYNDGCLRGLWVDLSTFCDYDEFITFCQAIHADEEDPELMAQDYECFPRQWYNEGFILRSDFEKILEYWDMCEKYSTEAVDDWMEFRDDLTDFEEAYCGDWQDEEDFARHIIDECYNLEGTMGDLARYFDYKAFGRELFMFDYFMGANNTVFRAV